MVHFPGPAMSSGSVQTGLGPSALLLAGCSSLCFTIRAASGQTWGSRWGWAAALRQVPGPWASCVEGPQRILVQRCVGTPGRLGWSFIHGPCWRVPLGLSRRGASRSPAWSRSSITVIRARPRQPEAAKVPAAAFPDTVFPASWRRGSDDHPKIQPAGGRNPFTPGRAEEEVCIQITYPQVDGESSVPRSVPQAVPRRVPQAVRAACTAGRSHGVYSRPFAEGRNLSAFGPAWPEHGAGDETAAPGPLGLLQRLAGWEQAWRAVQGVMWGPWRGDWGVRGHLEGGSRRLSTFRTRRFCGCCRTYVRWEACCPCRPISNRNKSAVVTCPLTGPRLPARRSHSVEMESRTRGCCRGCSARDSGWGECLAAGGFASRGAGLHDPTSVPGCVETQASGIGGLDRQQRRPRGRTEESRGLCGRCVSPTRDTSLVPFFKLPGKEPCPA